MSWVTAATNPVCKPKSGRPEGVENYEQGISGWGIDLDYCDFEWLVLEMN